MRDYELVVVMHPTITDEDMPQALDRVAGYIMSRGGTIASYSLDAPWGRRRLAYPIDDQTDGFYALFQFAFDPTLTTELDRAMKLDEEVLRFLVTRPRPEKAQAREAPAAADAAPASAAEPAPTPA